MDYKTVLKPCSAEVTVKRSRFIGALYPCKSAAEANKIISEVRQDHRDARHNCYAYIAGSEEKYSDDGEPHGTAGKPIMDVLKYNGLKNCVLVVTRYFGGILLGTGGLTRAYSLAASECAGSAETAVMKLCSFLSAEIGYADLSVIQNLCSERGAEILEPVYGENITLTVAVPVNEKEALLSSAIDKTGGRTIFKELKEDYYFFKGKKT